MQDGHVDRSERSKESGQQFTGVKFPKDFHTAENQTAGDSRWRCGTVHVDSTFESLNQFNQLPHALPDFCRCSTVPEVVELVYRPKILIARDQNAATSPNYEVSDAEESCLAFRDVNSPVQRAVGIDARAIFGRCLFVDTARTGADALVTVTFAHIRIPLGPSYDRAIPQQRILAKGDSHDISGRQDREPIYP